MRFVNAIAAALGWLVICLVFWTKTIVTNSELALLTTAIVVARALAGGDELVKTGRRFNIQSILEAMRT